MKKLLLIDDDAIQLRILKGILQERYQVLMAASGSDGIKIAGKKKPDLIFLDYEMPVMDGRETLGLLRENEDTRDIPVVFLTGKADENPEQRKEVQNLPVQGLVSKPAVPEELFGMIQKILGE